ncbi:MAG: hypothetical protein AMXMBFR79_18180 [Chitinophagaceae bacterium]
MIFIVIPVFNRKKFTYNCIKSLQSQTFTEFKIILVDDGSTDGTEELIKKEFPEVIILKGNGNLWWTGAINLGVNYVLNISNNKLEDFVLTLNNDLEISEDYIKNIYQSAITYSNSLIGSVSVDINNNDYLSFCGVKCNEYTAKEDSLNKKFNNSYSAFCAAFTKCLESDLLPGRGTLIPLHLFEKIGLYDNINFPHYAADHDFSLRAKRHGYKLLIFPSVVVKSHIEQTGISIENSKLSLKYFYNLFFSIKSPVNLKLRYRWAIKNTKLKFLYFMIGLCRVGFSSLTSAIKN